jgi:transposase
MKLPFMSDEEILEILALHDVDGWSFTQIAKKVRRSRHSIAGIVRRIRFDTDPVDDTPHLNGTLPARWWRRA